MMVRMLTTGMRIRKTTMIFEIVLIVCLAIPAGVIRYQDKQKAEIKSQYDAALTAYDANKNLAVSYLNVLTINSNEKYQEVKGSLSQYLSDDLKKELFSAEIYAKPAGEAATYNVLDAAGTMNGEGKETFKIKYELVKNGSSVLYTSLITIENGKIISVENLQ
jgi:hypothetical protein